jgi:hypothetical protein
LSTAAITIGCTPNAAKFVASVRRVEIDRYGEILIGCIDCNRWGYPGDEELNLELLEDDLEALRASVRRGHPPQ